MGTQGTPPTPPPWPYRDCRLARTPMVRGSQANTPGGQPLQTVHLVTSSQNSGLSLGNSSSSLERKHSCRNRTASGALTAERVTKQPAPWVSALPRLCRSGCVLRRDREWRAAALLVTPASHKRIHRSSTPRTARTQAASRRPLQESQLPVALPEQELQKGVLPSQSIPQKDGL